MSDYINGKLVRLGDYKAEADRKMEHYNTTNAYSTGVPALDSYFGGGYGQRGGYEIMTVFGGTGVGKSTVALNFLASPIKNGKKVGLIVLEDAYSDVLNRMQKIMPGFDLASADNIYTLEARGKRWTLENLKAQIDGWFRMVKIDVILLDHLQFAFEAADSIKGDNEFNRQRIFMRDLNEVMVGLEADGYYDKAIIIVSHTNKDKSNKGLAKIQGSGGIAQASTKVLEVEKVDTDISKLKFKLWKNRHTQLNDGAIFLKFEDQRLMYEL